ncbi:MAG: hypothetical protein ACI828_000499 [Flavobacteriales bacterium]|jgi:hypothetical protein
MKFNFVIVLSLFSATLLAQGPSVNTNSTANFLNAIDNQGASIGSSSLIRNPSRSIEGSVHLFDDWSSRGVAVVSADQKIRLQNMNFNVQRNTIESKLNRDSIFTFNVRMLEKIEINNRTFKYIYFPIKEGNRLLEVLGTSKDITIYKDYEIDIKEGNPNPMRGALKDKYIIRDQYYIQNGESFNKFKLKKKTILKVMGDKSALVKAYVDKNKLSFSKEDDISRIFSHYDNL